MEHYRHLHRAVSVTGTAPAYDPDAWAVEVIRVNGADLLGYLTRRTSTPADAADVLSNVFVVIWNKRKHLPQTATDARMWGFGIARNAMRDYRRQGVRQSALADALRGHLIEKLTLDRGTDPLEIAERTERNADVRSAVARLAKADRELIMLVHWDDLTLTEAATLLGLKPSTARTRYARARQRLAAQLADHHPPHGLSYANGTVRSDGRSNQTDFVTLDSPRHHVERE